MSAFLACIWQHASILYGILDSNGYIVSYIPSRNLSTCLMTQF